MMPERELWQSVVFQAFMDATWDEAQSDSQESINAKRQADAWIRGCGRDFRKVCALASLDPDFLSEAYINGRVVAAKLRANTTSVATAASRAKRLAGAPPEGQVGLSRGQGPQTQGDAL